MSRFVERICVAAAVMAAALVPAAFADTAKNSAIPNFASVDFGWQTNEEDWQPVARSPNHGPIRNDPAYPFTNNANGNRTHTQVTVRVTNTKDPILKPWVAAEIQKSNEEILRGEHPIPFTAQSRCWPGGTPAQSLYPFEPVYFIQTPKEVWMMWQRDHVVRRVFLTDKHSAHIKPSWFGESIGHYENGDTLVIDTIGLNTKTFVDQFRTPHTEKLHVVERYRLVDGGKAMEAIATVEDPGAFTMVWRAMQRYRRVEQGPMQENVCSENNEGFFELAAEPIPTAAKPDF
jgi:hypothetical protein